MSNFEKLIDYWNYLTHQHEWGPYWDEEWTCNGEGSPFLYPTIRECKTCGYKEYSTNLDKCWHEPDATWHKYPEEEE